MANNAIMKRPCIALAVIERPWRVNLRALFGLWALRRRLLANDYLWMPNDWAPPMKGPADGK